MRRRSSVIGKRGAGIHQPQTNQNARPKGQIKPIISTKKHGKTMNDFDFDNDIMPDFSGARRAAIAFLAFAALVALIGVAMCAATVAQ